MPIITRSILTLILATLITPVFAQDKPKEAAAPKDKEKDKYAWQPLFDGKTLKGWKESGYGGGS